MCEDKRLIRRIFREQLLNGKRMLVCHKGHANQIDGMTGTGQTSGFDIQKQITGM